jgi:hypothetical protein
LDFIDGGLGPSVASHYGRGERGLHGLVNESPCPAGCAILQLVPVAARILVSRPARFRGGGTIAEGRTADDLAFLRGFDAAIADGKIATTSGATIAGPKPLRCEPPESWFETTDACLAATNAGSFAQSVDAAIKR